MKLPHGEPRPDLLQFPILLDALPLHERIWYKLCHHPGWRATAVAFSVDALNLTVFRPIFGWRLPYDGLFIITYCSTFAASIWKLLEDRITLLQERVRSLEKIIEDGKKDAA